MENTNVKFKTVKKEPIAVFVDEKFRKDPFIRACYSFEIGEHFECNTDYSHNAKKITDEKTIKRYVKHLEQIGYQNIIIK